MREEFVNQGLELAISSPEQLATFVSGDVVRWRTWCFAARSSTYESLTDLVVTYQRLDQAGIRPTFCVNHGSTTSMYFSDPDGNQIELQVENYPSFEEAGVFLLSPAFAKNPIGIEPVVTAASAASVPRPLNGPGREAAHCPRFHWNSRARSNLRHKVGRGTVQ